MYNRYIPQPDGSFRRSKVQDRCPPPQPPRRDTPLPRNDSCQTTTEQVQINNQEHRQFSKTPPSKRETSISGFLRQILPQGLDTGDLLIILLLLLMAGDCADDQNTAMLTLAMYLFM